MEASTKNWLSMLDCSPEYLASLIARAVELKSGAPAANLKNKILGMMFFQPSLRTRTSFEAAMKRGGGDVITLSPGSDTWKFESKLGVVMNQDKAEHLKEAVAVLSRYVDAIGVRTFGKLLSLEEDEAEETLNAFAQYASVPVVSLESAVEHPCQGLADMLTLREKLGQTQGKKFVLSWAPHIKSLPLAVPHSAILAAAYSGMNITLAHPPGYDLSQRYLQRAKELCQSFGADFEVTTNQQEATVDADVIYAKSWGAPAFYKDTQVQMIDFQQYSNWRIRPGLLGRKALFMHCLPVRRNVVVDDAVLDGERSVVVDQAENRYWAQTAILEQIFKTV